MTNMQSTVSVWWWKDYREVFFSTLWFKISFFFPERIPFAFYLFMIINFIHNALSDYNKTLDLILADLARRAQYARVPKYLDFVTERIIYRSYIACNWHKGIELIKWDCSTTQRI